MCNSYIDIESVSLDTLKRKGFTDAVTIESAAVRYADIYGEPTLGGIRFTAKLENEKIGAQEYKAGLIIKDRKILENEPFYLDSTDVLDAKCSFKEDGTYSASIVNMSLDNSNKTYSVRAYVKADGETYYSDIKEFNPVKIANKVYADETLDNTIKQKYNSVYGESSDFYSAGEYVTEGPAYEWTKNPQKYKLIAFTFDDVPDDDVESAQNKINIMKKYEGYSTLFVIADWIGNATKNAPILDAIQNGFELGNHGKTTDILPNDVDEVLSSMAKTDKAIKDNFGISRTKWFRPSNLGVNAGVYQAATERGTPVVFQTSKMTAGDWDSNVNSSQLKASILNAAEDGAIILLHIWSKTTDEILDETLAELYNDGYRFVTLSQLFKFKGIDYDSIPKNLPIRDISCR